MSIVDAKTFALTNEGNSVGTVEYVTMTQSLYAQARVPDVGEGNIATFGIQGEEGYDFRISFTKDASVLYWYYGATLADAVASGMYDVNDMFSVYADRQTVVFKRNNSDIYNVPNPVTATAYRTQFILSTVVTPGTIIFNDALFYPSGARGKAGTPYTLIVETGGADILTESSFELFSVGDVVHTLESFPTTQGIYMQARIPATSTGNVTVGLGTPDETGENRFIRFSFFSDSTYLLKIKGFSGNAVNGTYESGDLVSMFLDDTSLIVYKNRLVVHRVNTQGTGIENRLYRFYAYSNGGKAVFRDVAFYQTGERGQEGAAFTTLVPQDQFAFVTSPTSFRFRSLDPFAETPTAGEVETSIQSAQEIDATVTGLFLQFKPFTVDLGSGDSVAMGFASATHSYGFIFREALVGGVNVNVYDTFASNVTLATGIPYVAGDRFTLYADGATVKFIVPGGTELEQPAFVPATTYKFVASASFKNNTDTLYDTTDFRFYPTGKIGPAGPQGPTFTTLTALNRATVTGTTQCVLNSVVGSISNVYTPEYFDLGSQGIALQTTLPGVSDETGHITIAFKLTNNDLGMYVTLTDGNMYTVYNNSVDNTVLATGTYTPGLVFRMYTDGRYAYASFNSAPPVALDEIQPYMSSPAYLYIESSNDFSLPGAYYFNNVRFYPTGKAVYTGNGLYDFSSAVTLASPVAVSAGDTDVIANITFPSTMPVSTADNCLVSVGLYIPTITYVTEKTCGYIEFGLSFENEVPRYYSVYLPMWVEYDTVLNRIVSSLRITMPAMLINVGTNPKDMVLYVKNNSNGDITFTGATNATVFIQTLNNNGVVTL